MIKLFALYKRPEDVEAFLDHYETVHIPLVRKIPGLKNAVVNRVTGSPMGGEPAYFQIAELQFTDKTAFEAAMASPEFRAAGKDVTSFAGDLVTLLIAEA